MGGRALATSLICLLLHACSQAPDATPAGSTPAAAPIVVAANYPMQFFAQEIAGDSVAVRLPRFDGDPAYWQPDSESIRLLQSADLLLLNGAGYESWLGWVTLPQDSPLDTSQNARDRLVSVEDQVPHQHGPGGQHSHGGVAFTTWLDPSMAAEQATAIERGLSPLFPLQASAYRERLVHLKARLEDLDHRLASTLSTLGDQPVVFSHPVYQYLARRYGLNAVSVHWEPDRTPAARDWIELQRLLRRHPARVMLWEDFPLETTARRLRELGVEPVVFQTLALPPERGDYFEAMEANIRRVSAILTSGS
jgi:zinc transport system substrate-binding protein